MLYTRTVSKLSNSAVVKMMGRSLALIASAGTLALASTAHANNGQFVDQVITVEINPSELATPQGTEKVYNKLKTKATRVCRADRKTLYYLGQSVDECASDLLEQFVTSSKLPGLQTFHYAKDI